MVSETLIRHHFQAFIWIYLSVPWIHHGEPNKVIQKKIDRWWLNQPLWRKSNWIILPRIGMKIKHIISNHHRPPGNSAGDLFWDGEFTWPFEMVVGWWPPTIGDEVRSRIESPGRFCFIGSSSYYLQLFCLIPGGEPDFWTINSISNHHPDFFGGFDPLTGRPSCCLSQMCYPSNARQALDVHLGPISDLHQRMDGISGQKKGLPPYCWWEKSGEPVDMVTYLPLFTWFSHHPRTLQQNQVQHGLL